MDKFQREVYDFIFSLFENEVVKDKAKDMMKDINIGFFEELSSSRKWCYHQCYEGGNADHTALATLDAYHSAITKKWMNIDTDDILITGLAHDIDKIGKYTKSLKVYARDDIETVNFLKEKGLHNNNIQDGVILAHGGWSRCKNVEHPPISIYMHAADMYGSHAIKTMEETRERIVDIIEEISRIKSK